MESIKTTLVSNALLHELVSALRMCEAELVTLKARLPEPYRRNVTAAAAAAKAALHQYEMSAPK